MELWQGIQEGALALLEGVTNAALAITKAFKSPQMVRVTRFIANIAPSLKPFVARIPAPGPVLEVLKTLVVDIIPAVARLLLDSIPRTETPEALGRKIERAAEMDMEPEDFDSTEEYLNHVREAIPDEPPEFFEAMDERDRLKYASVASGLYARSLEEKYGVMLEPAFWNAVAQSGVKDVFSMDALIGALKANGVEDGTLLDDFFAGRLENDPYEYECVDKSLQDALLQKMGDVGADVLRGQIDACVERYRRGLSGEGPNP